MWGRPLHVVIGVELCGVLGHLTFDNRNVIVVVFFGRFEIDRVGGPLLYFFLSIVNVCFPVFSICVIVFGRFFGYVGGYVWEAMIDVSMDGDFPVISVNDTLVWYGPVFVFVTFCVVVVGVRYSASRVCDGSLYPFGSIFPRLGTLWTYSLAIAFPLFSGVSAVYSTRVIFVRRRLFTLCILLCSAVVGLRSEFVVGSSVDYKTLFLRWSLFGSMHLGFVRFPSGVMNLFRLTGFSDA